MSESLAFQALKANKEYPHMDQHDIVFDLLDIEKRLESIESKLRELCAKPVDNTENAS